ncbi:hypothetical protein PtA15_16A189 [Puccinia triticina]|uniref:Uncharacterized protein n=1 Tax=Puccinia triticina TaxID=208348 RepID=A0ABY7D5B5_9BASI|nr:uncharacterized protein PtA15_16A189 [Puccinia triticina]WAQ92283.1 hypothetical protein PtA15_16A189 [Puccinia triticina]WAR64020.1 hypothetical protein PtB15_16B179 [Puccinia triticina]
MASEAHQGLLSKSRPISQRALLLLGAADQPQKNFGNPSTAAALVVLWVDCWGNAASPDRLAAGCDLGVLGALQAPISTLAPLRAADRHPVKASSGPTLSIPPGQPEESGSTPGERTC